MVDQSGLRGTKETTKLGPERPTETGRFVEGRDKERQMIMLNEPDSESKCLNERSRTERAC